VPPPEATSSNMMSNHKAADEVWFSGDRFYRRCTCCSRVYCLENDGWAEAGFTTRLRQRAQYLLWRIAVLLRACLKFLLAVVLFVGLLLKLVVLASIRIFISLLRLIYLLFARVAMLAIRCKRKIVAAFTIRKVCSASSDKNSGLEKGSVLCIRVVFANHRELDLCMSPRDTVGCLQSRVAAACALRPRRMTLRTAGGEPLVDDAQTLAHALNASGDAASIKPPPDADASFPAAFIFRAYKKPLKAEDLPSIADDLESTDQSVQTLAVSELRHLIPVGVTCSPELDAVMQCASIMPRVIQFLAVESLSKLQVEAAHVLIKVASAGTLDQVKTIVDMGCLPSSVQLVSNQNSDLADKGIALLGAIASRSIDLRDAVLASSALAAIANRMTRTEPVQHLRTASESLKVLSGGSPLPSIDTLLVVWPAVSCQIFSEETDVLKRVCWVLANLYEACPRNRIHLVLQRNITERLVDLLSNPLPAVQMPVLRAVGLIAFRDETHTKVLTERSALNRLVPLIASSDKGVRVTAIWAVGWFLSRSLDLIQAVIDAGVIRALVQVMSTSEFDSRKKAAWAISRAASCGSSEHIRHLIREGCEGPLSSLLMCFNDPEALALAHGALDDIRKKSEPKEERDLASAPNTKSPAHSPAPSPTQAHPTVAPSEKSKKQTTPLSTAPSPLPSKAPLVPITPPPQPSPAATPPVVPLESSSTPPPLNDKTPTPSNPTSTSTTTTPDSKAKVSSKQKQRKAVPSKAAAVLSSISETKEDVPLAATQSTSTPQSTPPAKAKKTTLVTSAVVAAVAAKKKAEAKAAAAAAAAAAVSSAASVSSQPSSKDEMEEEEEVESGGGGGSRTASGPKKAGNQKEGLECLSSNCGELDASIRDGDTWADVRCTNGCLSAFHKSCWRAYCKLRSLPKGGTGASCPRRCKHGEINTVFMVKGPRILEDLIEMGADKPKRASVPPTPAPQPVEETLALADEPVTEEATPVVNASTLQPPSPRQEEALDGDGESVEDLMERTSVRGPRRGDCVFFVHKGWCRYGDSCRLHHPTPGESSMEPASTRSDVVASSKTTVVCRYYRQLGSCKYGDRCWFLHSIPAAPSTISSSPVALLASTTSVSSMDAQDGWDWPTFTSSTAASPRPSLSPRSDYVMPSMPHLPAWVRESDLGPSPAAQQPSDDAFPALPRRERPLLPQTPIAPTSPKWKFPVEWIEHPERSTNSTTSNEPSSSSSSFNLSCLERPLPALDVSWIGGSDQPLSPHANRLWATPFMQSENSDCVGLSGFASATDPAVPQASGDMWPRNAVPVSAPVVGNRLSTQVMTSAHGSRAPGTSMSPPLPSLQSYSLFNNAAPVDLFAHLIPTDRQEISAVPYPAASYPTAMMHTHHHPVPTPYTPLPPADESWMEMVASMETRPTTSGGHRPSRLASWAGSLSDGNVNGSEEAGMPVGGLTVYDEEEEGENALIESALEQVSFSARDTPVSDPSELLAEPEVLSEVSSLMGEIDALSVIEGNMQPDECIICADNKVNSVILECGHCVLCMKCGTEKNLEKCPVCRNDIVRIVRIYRG